MKRIILVFIIYLASNLSVASENNIYGFIADHNKLERLIGSGDTKLIDAILKDQQSQVESVTYRIDSWAEYKEREPISIELGLSQMLNAQMQEAISFEYLCMSELLIRQIGQQLDDTGKNNYNGPLSTYLDLWLEDPDPFFEQLNLNTIANIWARHKNPLIIPGEADWPAVNSLTPQQINQAQQEFNAADLKTIIKMKKIKIDGRGDEYSQKELRQIMFDTISELARWVHVAYDYNQKNPSSPASLVLIFDGDL